MEEQTRELLHAIFVYSKILNDANTKLHQLINTNTQNNINENEQLFYEIVSEIMRVLPVKKENGEIKGLNLKAGILLLSEKMSFVVEAYQQILERAEYKQILLEMTDVRNKFIHEPHNMHAAFYVGGETSCSMGIYYKDILCSISTIKISYIISELNKIFQELKMVFLELVDQYDEKYKEYPIYKSMQNFDFEKHNEMYPMMPLYMMEEEQEDREEM